MSDGQPPAEANDYRSPFLTPSAPPPGADYPPQPPYADAPPSPEHPPSAASPAPLFDPDALFRPPPAPRPAPSYPTGGPPGGSKVTPVTIAVVAVLALVGAGVWAVGQQGKGVMAADTISGGVPTAPDLIAVADLPPPPPMPVGYQPRHISGMTFAVPGDCLSLAGRSLSQFTYSFSQHLHVLDACISADGNRLVMVASVDFNVPPDAALQSPATQDQLRMLFSGEAMAPPDVRAHDILGRPGLLVSVGFTCGCQRSVFFTIGEGSGADNDLYLVLVGQVDTPPDAGPIIDSARPTR